MWENFSRESTRKRIASTGLHTKPTQLTREFLAIVTDELQFFLTSALRRMANWLGIVQPKLTQEIPDLIIDGPATAPAIILLGSGSHEPVTGSFMTVVAHELARRGWQIARFDFSYMKRRRVRPRTGSRTVPQDSIEALQADFIRKIKAVSDGRPLFIGGKSISGLIASQIADQVDVKACIGLGYPFYSPWKPDEDQAYRVKHLANLQTPMLIIQGDRDEYGDPDYLQNVNLSSRIEINWIKGRNHRFQSCQNSNETEQECLREAIEMADIYIRKILVHTIDDQQQKELASQLSEVI